MKTKTITFYTCALDTHNVIKRYSSLIRLNFLCCLDCLFVIQFMKRIWRLQALRINITNDATEPGCNDYANGLILQ